MKWPYLERFPVIPKKNEEQHLEIGHTQIEKEEKSCRRSEMIREPPFS